MKIAGIYPQPISIDSKIQHAVSEPYGLEMILAMAKKEGHEVELFMPVKRKENQLVPVSENEYFNKIADYKPDVAAFSLYTCQYLMGKRIASRLKKNFPKIKTIAGNRYPTHLKEKIEDPFDFFVLKEGEETFKEWLRETEGKKDYESVKGLIFKKNGKPIFTGVRKRKFNLDSLPDALRFPVILNQVYKGISIPPLSTNPHYAIVEYSRCCYNNCKFCDNEGFWGNKVAFKSAKRVVEEIKELKQKGVDIFYFMDLNFTAFPKKTKELCTEMLKENLGVSWYCMSNIATLDGKKDLLDLMKKAGCYKIAWGVESTNDNALKHMDKKVGSHLTTNNQAIRVLKDSFEAGLINQGYYIIGFPWETKKSILKDAKQLKHMPLHQLNIGIFTPIPMSRFYKEMQDSGYRLDANLDNHNRNNLVYDHHNLRPSEIKYLQEKIYKAFYQSPEYNERLSKTCKIDPSFIPSFKDYNNFLEQELNSKERVIKVA